MKIKIEKCCARGEIYAPPSKSYAHRMLIAGALANGESEISGISDSVDMRATLECIQALGVSYTKNGEDVSVFGGINQQENALFNCYESGSTLRFFIPIALLSGKGCTFIGTERLLARGLDIYFNIFKELGISYELTKTALTLSGKLKPSHFKVRGDVSSQFITGLLFALPLLEGDSIIEITTPLESSLYVDITIDVLKSFGIEISREENVFKIRGNQKYLSTRCVVEGDMSNSAFLEAFNLLGGDVSVLGLNKDSIQPDSAYFKYFPLLKEKKAKIDLSGSPDLGPIAFSLAGALNGATFVGTKRLRIKESDRVLAVVEELSKFGIKSDVYENSVVIYGGTLKKPSEELNSHNDHRIVMSLAVLSTLVGATIDGCESVNKSYPTFFDDIKKLGVRFSVIEN